MDSSNQSREIAAATIATQIVVPTSHVIPSSPITFSKNVRNGYNFDISCNTTKREELLVIAYKECLKNHAAALGTTATDGCGEFMPSSDTLSCSACGCHRNFHRREVAAEGSNNVSKCLYWSTTRHITAPSPQELSQCHQSEGVLKENAEELGEVKRKRHRTKFTCEQKEKMLVFAERAGWKIQKLDAGTVQQFCQEVGIKRRVLKVWMHNNKNNFVKTNNNVFCPDHDDLSNSNSSYS